MWRGVLSVSLAFRAGPVRRVTPLSVGSAWCAQTPDVNAAPPLQSVMVPVQTSVSRFSNTFHQWKPGLSWGTLYGANRATAEVKVTCIWEAWLQGRKLTLGSPPFKQLEAAGRGCEQVDTLPCARLVLAVKTQRALCSAVCVPGLQPVCAQVTSKARAHHSDRMEETGG